MVFAIALLIGLYPSQTFLIVEMWDATKPTYDMKKLPKIALFGILVQSAGLIYGIVNKAEDIIIMCLIFMFVSCLPLFDKKK